MLHVGIGGINPIQKSEVVVEWLPVVLVVREQLCREHETARQALKNIQLFDQRWSVERVPGDDDGVGKRIVEALPVTGAKRLCKLVPLTISKAVKYWPASR